MTNQTVALENGTLVHRFNIITTTHWVYQALEPRTTHHSIQSFDGQWYGSIGSQDIPVEIDNLPAFSNERSRAFRTWHAAEMHRAYRAILAAFPEAKDGFFDNGEITITL